MLYHTIPSNTTVDEVVRQIELDPKATEREKFLAEALRIAGSTLRNWCPGNHTRYGN